MNADVATGPVWSRSRWVGMVSLVFGVQILSVFSLSERRPVIQRRVPDRPVISLVLNAEANARLQQVETVRDPTLFALVNQRGFSGRAWLLNPPREHSTTEWIEPPQLLGADVNQLSFTPSATGMSNAEPTSILDGKSAPRLKMKLLPQTPLTHRTTLRIEGRLEGRGVQSQPELPALPLSDVLAPTTIEVIVNQEGNVISARSAAVRGGKGGAQDVADQQALELVKAIRFEPLPPDPNTRVPQASKLTWGRVIFHWQTIAGAPPAPGKANP